MGKIWFKILFIYFYILFRPDINAHDSAALFNAVQYNAKSNIIYLLNNCIKLTTNIIHEVAENNELWDIFYETGKINVKEMALIVFNNMNKNYVESFRWFVQMGVDLNELVQ